MHSAVQPVLQILPGSTPAHLFIRISAHAGQMITLQESSDLAAWGPVESRTLTTGSVTVEVQSSPPPSRQFFRAQWTPGP